MRTLSLLAARLPAAPVAARLSTATALGLLAACGTVTVRVPVMKPAEINMAPYRSVGLGEITQSGYAAGSTVIASLVEQALVETGRFQVVDRQHMDQVMRELQLSASDLADSSKAAKLGQLVTAGALVYGSVDEKYKETAKEEKSVDKDKKAEKKDKK